MESRPRAEGCAPGSAPLLPVGTRGSGSRSAAAAGVARGQPPAAGSACGVWSGGRACACVKLEEEGERRSSSSFPFFPDDGSGLQRFPGVESETTATAQREHPKTEGRRTAFPQAPVNIPGVRNAAGAPKSRSDGRSRAAAALLPPVPGCWGAWRGGGTGKFQHLRSSAVCSLEGNGYFRTVFCCCFAFFLFFVFFVTSGHPPARGERRGGGDGRQL